MLPYLRMLAALMLELQNLNAITELDSAMAAKAEALERVYVVEGTAASSLARWTLQNGDVLPVCDEARTAVQRLSTVIMAVGKQFSDQTTAI